MIVLGATVKDKITGFKGIATGKATYITGCDQYMVQPKTKNGDFVEARWFDDNRLETVGSEVIEIELNGKVGPCGSAPIK